MSLPSHSPNPNPCFITVENIRHYLLDRQASDNSLDLDLSFGEPEILDAFKYAASDYNDMPPQVHQVCASRLPFHTFLVHDVIYHLYLSKLSQYQRNDIDFSAGGLTVDVEKRRIEHLTKTLPVMKESFLIGAKEYKISINLRRGVGRVG